jgi:ketosteroid isomerase-like protein
MSMDRETTVRDFVDALNAGDAAGAAALLTDDCVIHVLPNALVDSPGTFRGRVACEELMAQVLASASIQQEVEAVTTSGGFASAFVRSTTTDESGAENEIWWADLYRFEGDKIAEHVAMSG